MHARKIRSYKISRGTDDAVIGERSHKLVCANIILTNMPSPLPPPGCACAILTPSFRALIPASSLSSILRVSPRRIHAS